VTLILELHLKVISAYVVILISNISEIMCDTSTETEIANKKSYGSFQWYDCRRPWRYFKVIRLCHIKFLVNGAWYWYGKSYCRPIGNLTLAFDWCHIRLPWRTFEGHFSLCCHFHVQYPRQDTVNETICMKSHESFQMIHTLPMILAIFQGHWTVRMFHSLVILQKLLQSTTNRKA